MELIELLNIIEVGLLSGIMMLIVIFGIVIHSKLKSLGTLISMLMHEVTYSERQKEEPEPIKLKDLQTTEPVKVKIEIPKPQPQPVQEVPIQEKLKLTIPRPESVSAKGTCDWCGNEYSNLPVHKRFCKSKPPAT